MVEKSGSTVTYTVNYAYNALGQLAKLTDGTGDRSSPTPTTTWAS